MSGLVGRRILVVDDEMLIAILAEELLVSAGATPVGPACSVEEALGFVEAGGFDAVMLDVNLSGKSSEPLGLLLSERKIPYIVVTGYGKVDWADGRTTVVAKPYTAQDIVPALEAALASVQNT